MRKAPEAEEWVQRQQWQRTCQNEVGCDFTSDLYAPVVFLFVFHVIPSGPGCSLLWLK